MEKNWLIRTRSKKILGPISKEKLVEFVNKGSLVPEDEITSGNGYWFKVKEKDLVDKYIMGDIPQSFNPISEAPNILTAFNQKERETTASFKPSGLPREIVEKSGEVLPENDDLDYPDPNAVIPDQDDLEYPDMNAMSQDNYDFEFDDHTVVSNNINLNDLKNSPKKESAPAPVFEDEDDLDTEALIPEDSDLEYPEVFTASDRKSVEAEVEIKELEALAVPAPKVEQLPPRPEVSEKPKASAKVDKPQKKVVKKKTIKKTKATKVAPKSQPKPQKGMRNDFVFLFLLIGLVLMAFYGVFYYWTEVLHKDIPFVSSANAQEVVVPVKKKA